MRILLTVIRVYWILVLIWALSTWFGGIPGPIGSAITWLTWPIWYPLRGLTYRGVGFGPMVMLLALWGLDAWLTTNYNKRFTKKPNFVHDPED